MAWEWLAPAAAVAGAFVGGGTTWLVSRSARKHAETLADKNHAHTERLAHQARQQKRLRDAYVDMLAAVEGAAYWADSLLPAFDTEPPEPLPDLPSYPEQQRLHALVMAYGSEEVNTLVDRYMKIVGDLYELHALVVHWRSAETRREEDEGELIKQIRDELLPAEKLTRTELRQRVAEELRPPLAV